ncbi:hypothetical protein [Thauera sp. 2A1]|uniref:hypothetical protein n=1 Tax=Thauera sp. 2A1 TaxID=2570191 RepID=UPI001291A5E8|nr:hypothetical protein [Thauera sp. 2A1]KAI5915559.1 hypothetical protein GH664_06330 [Thauera sp. 2A1]
MRTKTICKETEQQLIEVATKLGYRQMEKIGSEGARTKVLVFKSDRLLTPIVVHKDTGLADGRLSKLQIAVRPSMYQSALENPALGIRASSNRQKGGVNHFQHSAYRAFAEPTIDGEPVGKRYEIDWTHGGPAALTTLLTGLVKT